MFEANLVGLSSQMGLDVLAGDFVWEVVRFIFFLIVIVCAVVIGAKLRKGSDARKEAKEALIAASEAAEPKDVSAE